MSLRLRITISTALLILLSTSALAFLAFSTAKRIQVDTVDNAIIGASAQVRTRAIESNPRPLPPDVYQPFAVALIKPGSTTAQVLLPAGFGEQPINFPTITVDQARGWIGSMVNVPGDPPYRMYVRESGPQNAVLIVGMPTDDLERGLRSLAIGLVSGVAIITLVGAIVAWLLVRRFFRPVDEMVDAAIGIAAGDVGLRVPDAPAGTELGELSTALNSMIESLTTGLRVVGESEGRLRAFVSDASHEIRTPLTVIRGYVDLLQGERTDASDLERRALDRISSESKRLENLVTQLLLLERIDRGVGDVEQFDFSVLVREYIGDLEDLGDGRPVTWLLEPALVTGNADLWRQALANIAQNLERHTPEGSAIVVTVSADPTVLTIDDAGPGIPPDKRAAVVQRFTRLDESRSSNTGGFGLGMSVIAAVVAQHNARLELTESPLGGLRLRIAIP